MDVGIIAELPIKWYEHTPAKIGINICLATLAGMSFKCQGSPLHGIRISKTTTHLISIVCTISLICFNIGLLLIRNRQQKISEQNKQKIEEINAEAKSLSFNDWQKKYPDDSVLKYLNSDALGQLRKKFLQWWYENKQPSLSVYENEQPSLSLLDNPFFKWLEMEATCPQELKELSKRIVKSNIVTTTDLSLYFTFHDTLDVPANTKLIVDKVNTSYIESLREILRCDSLAEEAKWGKINSTINKIFNDFLHPIGKSLKGTSGILSVFSVYHDASAFAIEGGALLQVVTDRGSLITTPKELCARMIKANKLTLNLEDNQPILFVSETPEANESILRMNFLDWLGEQTLPGYGLNFVASHDVEIFRGRSNDGILGFSIKGIGAPLEIKLIKINKC